MAAFKDLKNPKEIKNYLLNVLSRTGGKSKDEVCLYHYSRLSSLLDILSSGFIWLGSSEYMNDYLEGEFINAVDGRSKLFFSCFSRVEENLAMYKMYAPSPDGAMMSIPFRSAQEIIDNLPTVSQSLKSVRIVRDNKLTNERVEANVYWAAIAYKDLHTDLLKADTVVNTQIENPINNDELAGYVKLYGWEYEKEIRLCASLKRPIASNERIAIPIPKGVLKDITVITGPAFDKEASRKDLAKIKRIGISIHDSEYDALVDLGYNVTSLEKKIAELTEENRQLKARIQALENNNKVKVTKLKSDPIKCVCSDWGVEKDNIQLLSDVVLLYAAEYDGTIDVNKSVHGSTYVVGHMYNMNASNDGEEIAKWDAVIDCLFGRKYIKVDKTNGSHTIYRVCYEGYNIAKGFKTINEIDVKNNAPQEIIRNWE